MMQPQTEDAKDGQPPPEPGRGKDVFPGAFRGSLALLIPWFLPQLTFL